MKKETVLNHKASLLKTAPEINNYINTFHSINSRWHGAITAGMIETGYMDTEVARLFDPLIQDMHSTKRKYSRIQEELVDAILFEMVKKVVLELNDSAKFAINIVKRNLFERTADVGYLATDGDIVDLLKLVRNDENPDRIETKACQVRKRLVEYQYEYTVYDEIIIFDTKGRVRANLNASNTISHSRDPLIGMTMEVDLHNQRITDKYIETYRRSDIRPGCGDVLIYSQKIEDPDTLQTLGVLCLCFDFADEMDRIYKDLNQGNSRMTIGVVDAAGKVMSANHPNLLPVGSVVPVDLEADFRLLNFNGRQFLVSMAATDGYQGFFGLTWYAVTMIDMNTALHREGDTDVLDWGTSRQLKNVSTELAAIHAKSEDLLGDIKIDSVNGQIMANKFSASAFNEVLHEVKWVGEEINELFSAAISNLQGTIVTSLFNDVQFRAFQGNNIADRNLYERANDVCWWALTPLFRNLLVKHQNQGLDDDDRTALTRNLQYINDLYTPYMRLVLADTKGTIIAVSDPPKGLEERLVDDTLPTGQKFVGTMLDGRLVKKAVSLRTSKDFCVSDFVPTPLYGGRPTYIYSTAVRDPENDSRVVGVIQIVFDAEPQFNDMLMDVLPRDEKQQLIEGTLGIFSDRKKTIIAATIPDYEAGGQLPLNDDLFTRGKGERTSTLVELDGRHYTVGIQVSDGYREFKGIDSYVNDVVCLVFVPL